MTNPAYECKRKRSRDKFILNKLFGNGGPGIEMTNLFGNNTNMNMNMNEPLM